MPSDTETQSACFEDGRIIEDWAASDTMEIPRQLGVWRSLLLLVQRRKLLRNRS
jgi:hypothetical protein